MQMNVRDGKIKSAQFNIMKRLQISFNASYLFNTILIANYIYIYIHTYILWITLTLLFG